MKILSILIVVLFVVSMSFLMYGNQGIPKGISVVEGFDGKRYAGTWYEIARLDHGFEKGLNHVSAEFSPREDGGFDILNKGFNAKTGAWENSKAKAFFIDRPDLGRMKVSFSGPFYGAYNIIDLDKENYSYAMVTGPKTHYFWILSRQKTIDPAIMQKLVQKAIGLGFKLDKIIYVDQKDSTVPPEGVATPATAPAN